MNHMQNELVYVLYYPTYCFPWTSANNGLQLDIHSSELQKGEGPNIWEWLSFFIGLIKNQRKGFLEDLISEELRANVSFKKKKNAKRIILRTILHKQ